MTLPDDTHEARSADALVVGQQGMIYPNCRSENPGTPVNLTYHVPFNFTGKLDKLTIDLQ